MHPAVPGSLPKELLGLQSRKLLEPVTGTLTVPTSMETKTKLDMPCRSSFRKVLSNVKNYLSHLSCGKQETVAGAYLD